MTVNNILTTPPILFNSDGKKSNAFNVMLQRKASQGETTFKFPFITNSPLITKLESDPKKICSALNLEDSKKDERAILYHQVFCNHNDSRSPESIANIMTDRISATDRKPLEQVTPITNSSSGYKENLSCNGNSLKDNSPDFENKYLKNLKELVNSVVSGLLDLEEEVQLNRQDPQISPIWNNSEDVENSLQGSYIYAKNTTAFQELPVKIAATNDSISNNDTYEKLHKNNEIKFEIWGWETYRGQKISDFNSKNSLLLKGEYTPTKARILEAQMMTATHIFKLENQYNIGNTNYTCNLSHRIAADRTYQKIPNIQDNPDLFITKKYEFSKIATYSEEHGLIYNSNGKLLPNDKLTEIYSKYASKYFSVNEASQLVDYMKAQITPLKKLHEIRIFGDSTGVIDSNIDHFANFLLWYKEMKSRPSSSHYYTRGVMSPPDIYLFLCATKNGKLDIYSAPKASKMYIRRGDIVITQGDKGCDLVAVIEPVMGKKLAYLLQFMKKKLEVDAISTPNEIHDNLTFIKDFMNTIRSKNELIDTSRYGLIDMTRSDCFRSRIVRFATEEETTESLFLKFRDELKLLHIINTKIDSYNEKQSRHQSSQIDVKLLAADIQFDRSKSSIHFIGHHIINFTPIISDVLQSLQIHVSFHSVPSNLGVDERYFRYTCNEISMLQNMVISRNLPYIHYNSKEVSYNATDISRIRDYNNKNLESNPTNDKWKDTLGLSRMELDNYYIGAYQQLTTDLFN